MTWDKATNLAAVARGGACSASGKWLILRTYRVMGWGRGGKPLYRGCTWGESGGRKRNPSIIRCTEKNCFMPWAWGLFPPVSSLLQPNPLKWTFGATKSHKTCNVSSAVVSQWRNTAEEPIFKHTVIFFVQRAATYCYLLHFRNVITGNIFFVVLNNQSGKCKVYYYAYSSSSKHLFTMCVCNDDHRGICPFNGRIVSNQYLTKST